MAESYSRISLQKNGAVTNTVGYRTVDLRGIPTVPIVPGTLPQVNTAVNNVGNQIQNALTASITNATTAALNNVTDTIGKHEIDIVVAILGLVIIVSAISSILRPFV